MASLYGERNGTMTLNLSRGTALWLASRLLGEDLQDAEEETWIDAVCEIGNQVAGRFMELLRNTPFQFGAISVPALVAGADYSVHYHRGILSAAVEFELPQLPMSRVQDRFFSSSISMMRPGGAGCSHGQGVQARRWFMANATVPRKASRRAWAPLGLVILAILAGLFFIYIYQLGRSDEMNERQVLGRATQPGGAPSVGYASG